MTQESYQDLAQQSQAAFKNAMDTWTKTVQETLTSVGAPAASTQVDPQLVVDQVFEFAESMLKMQRDLTRTLLESSVAMQQGLTRPGGTTEASGT